MSFQLVISVFILGMASQVLSEYMLEDESTWVFISLLFLNANVGLFKSFKEFRDGR